MGPGLAIEGPWRRCMISMIEIQELNDRIVREYQPSRIVLFGSYANGTPNDESDVDLLVVMPFDGAAFEKSLEITRRIGPTFRLDLLARRPDDTARRYREWDPLVREALDRGVVLFDSGSE